MWCGPRRQTEVVGHASCEFLTVMKKVGRRANKLFEPNFVPRGREAQLCEEVQTGGRDPLSCNQRTDLEGLWVIVKVVDYLVHDFRWDPDRFHRYRRSHCRARGRRSGMDVVTGKGSRDVANDRFWFSQTPRNPGLSLTAMKKSLQRLVWLGVLAISTVTTVVASDQPQVVIDGPGEQPPHEWHYPAFDSAEDIVDRWVENGRQFINRNGQTCT